MKKIGILETRVHPTYLYSTMKILKSKDTSVSIFTIQENRELIAPLLSNTIDDYSWAVKNPNESTMVFLKRIKYTIENELDILYVNTIQGGIRDIWAYYCFNPKVRKYLTIHNPHFWFTYNRNKRIKEFISFFLRRRILKYYDALIGVSSKVRKYLINSCGYKNTVYVLPFSVYDNYEDNYVSESIVFTAPGAIEKKRRDYHILLDVFERLFTEYPNIQLKIIGKPVDNYGQSIIERCQQLKDKGYNIYVSNNYLSGDCFEKELKESHILIGAINMSLYDESKETGVVYDAIRYAKPIILPEGYDIPDELKSSVLFFKNYDYLYELIKFMIINNGQLNVFKSNAKNNSLLFSSDYIRNNKNVGL